MLSMVGAVKNTMVHTYFGLSQFGQTLTPIGCNWPEAASFG